MMVKVEKQAHFNKLVEVYNQSRGRRTYVPISELVRGYRMTSSALSDEVVSQIITELQCEYPQRIKFDKKRGVREAVVRITSA